MVEGTGLENRRARKGLVSSNLTLSVPDPCKGACGHVEQRLGSIELRMGGRVVEGARLESVWARKGLASSNLAPSVLSLF